MLCCVTKMSGVLLQEAMSEATRALGINHPSFVTFSPFFAVTVLEKLQIYLLVRLSTSHKKIAVALS